MTLDRHDPEGSIAEAAKACSNWGRWGEDDVLGTLNFLDEAKRREGAALVRRGVSFSLSQRFDMNGPQKGWRRRTNPVHTMLDTGTDAALGNQGFPHGIGGADHAWRARPDARACSREPSSYLKHLYFDSLVHDPHVLRELIRVVRADRVLLGSDFPFDMGTDDPLDALRAAGLPEHDFHAVRGGNAAALLNLS